MLLGTYPFIVTHTEGPQEMRRVCEEGLLQVNALPFSDHWAFNQMKWIAHSYYFATSENDNGPAIISVDNTLYKKDYFSNHPDQILL